MHKQSPIETPFGGLLVEASSNGDISLAMGDLPGSIANGMTIDKSIAFVVTVKPILKTTDIKFTANLLDETLNGHADTGECLECIQFENDGWHLTIGTEDLPTLDNRLSELSILRTHNQIIYSPSGIALELCNLNLTAEKTFHFVISYKKLPDEQECSAWFFADISHDLAIKATTS